MDKQQKKMDKQVMPCTTSAFADDTCPKLSNVLDVAVAIFRVNM
jgi:hypothetical protein